MYLICTVCFLIFFFFFKQKTAYEMRISDWSSDVCSSDLRIEGLGDAGEVAAGPWRDQEREAGRRLADEIRSHQAGARPADAEGRQVSPVLEKAELAGAGGVQCAEIGDRMIGRGTRGEFGPGNRRQLAEREWHPPLETTRNRD